MYTRIGADRFRRAIREECQRYVSRFNAGVIADRITQSELMGVSSHGLHYFLHSIRPLIESNHINRSDVSVSGIVVNATGDGGVGFKNVERCLKKASAIAARKGCGLVVFKNPGKVGALRIYCQDIMDKGQMILLMKNTAATVGLPESKKPLIGTNPLCVGLPDSKFIYDSSVSTVATNKMRIHAKAGRAFPSDIGLDASGQLTKEPLDILQGEGYLLPFSFGDYAFKGFFLGVIVECISAMAGGKTSIRVGKNKGARLYSDEGMFALVIDKRVFPDYSNYLKEMPLLFADLKAARVRLPNSGRVRKTVTVLRQDWNALLAS